MEPDWFDWLLAAVAFGCSFYITMLHRKIEKLEGLSKSQIEVMSKMANRLTRLGYIASWNVTDNGYYFLFEPQVREPEETITDFEAGGKL